MKTKTDNKAGYCQDSELAYKCLAISCHDKKNYRHYTSGEIPNDSQSRGKGVNDALTGGSNASGQPSPHATPLQAHKADLKGEKECRQVLRLLKEMEPRLIEVSNGIDLCRTSTLHICTTIRVCQTARKSSSKTRNVCIKAIETEVARVIAS